MRRPSPSQRLAAHLLATSGARPVQPSSPHWVFLPADGGADERYGGLQRGGHEQLRNRYEHDGSAHSYLALQFHYELLDWRHERDCGWDRKCRSVHGSQRDNGG